MRSDSQGVPNIETFRPIVVRIAVALKLQAEFA
jgi:hypothetical protein